MAAAVRLYDDFDGPGLRAPAKATKDAAQGRRLLALAEIYDGCSRTDAARIGGVGLQTVRDWVLRFNARGPDGLIDGKALGRPSGSSKSSTVGTATLFGLLLPDRRRPGAMTPRDGAGSPGWSGIDPIESDRRSQSLMTHDLSRKAVPPDQDRGQAFSGSCSGSDAAFKLTHCIMGVGFTSVRLGADATFRCGKPVERFFNQIRRYRCVSFSRDSSGNIGAAAPRSRRCRAPA